MLQLARRQKGSPESSDDTFKAMSAACEHLLSCAVEEIDREEVAFDEDIEDAQAGGVVDFIVELGSDLK